MGWLCGVGVFGLVTILKTASDLKVEMEIDVDAGLVFILNIDTRSQFPEKWKVVRGEKMSQLQNSRKAENQLENSHRRSQRKQPPNVSQATTQSQMSVVSASQ